MAAPLTGEPIQAEPVSGGAAAELLRSAVSVALVTLQALKFGFERGLFNKSVVVKTAKLRLYHDHVDCHK